MTTNNSEKPDGYGFEFRHQYDAGAPEIVVRTHRDSTLDDMCQVFETFLKATGYAPDLEVVITIPGNDTDGSPNDNR